MRQITEDTGGRSLQNQPQGETALLISPRSPRLWKVVRSRRVAVAVSTGRGRMCTCTAPPAVRSVRYAAGDMKSPDHARHTRRGYYSSYALAVARP
jgi:hypothetical protein